MSQRDQILESSCKSLYTEICMVKAYERGVSTSFTLFLHALKYHANIKMPSFRALAFTPLFVACMLHMSMQADTGEASPESAAHLRPLVSEKLEQKALSDHHNSIHKTEEHSEDFTRQSQALRAATKKNWSPATHRKVLEKPKKDVQRPSHDRQ